MLLLFFSYTNSAKLRVKKELENDVKCKLNVKPIVIKCKNIVNNQQFN